MTKSSDKYIFKFNNQKIGLIVFVLFRSTSNLVRNTWMQFLCNKNWVPHEIRISLKWLLVLLIWINSNNNNHLDYYLRVKVLAIVCYKYLDFRPWSASSVITSARELPNNHILRIICNLIPYLYGSSILF